MLKFNKRIKFNKICESIIKSFIIFIFALAIFDKSSINYIKDIVIKLDAEQIVSNFTKIFMAFKALSFDLPILFTFFVVVFNIICITSFLILLIIFIQKLLSNFFVDLNISKFKNQNNKSCEIVSSIYLINERFRC